MKIDNEGAVILPQDAYRRILAKLDHPDDWDTFESTGNPPKPVTMSDKDMDEQAKTMADFMRKAGLEEEHTYASWGAAPESNHMSQAVPNAGAENVVGEDQILNNSIRDFNEYRDRWSEVNAIFSLPLPVVSMGERMENEMGLDPAEEFPDLELILTAGDVMTPALREEIGDLFGLESPEEQIVNGYGSTEGGFKALEVKPGTYRPHDPMETGVTIELIEEGSKPIDTGVRPETQIQVSDYLPENLNADLNVGNKHPEENIHDIFDLDEEKTGSLILTADREASPAVRWRLGDIWSARPGDEGPLMEYRGREDNAINVGPVIYPDDLQYAASNVTEAPDPEYFLAIPTLGENGQKEIDIHLDADPQYNPDNLDHVFLEYLSGTNNSVEEWDEESVELTTYLHDSRREMIDAIGEGYDVQGRLEHQPKKSQRVMKDSSWPH